jgi:hypothetical protein
MITAIINKLKTGSITNVIPKGGILANPETPYVVVWKDSPIVQSGRMENSGTNQYYISVHYPKGYINQIDDYIENETVSLLDGVTFSTRDGRKVKLHKTADMSPLIEGNDDGTISRDRLFMSVAIY